jgi:hypothetical protein
VLASSGVEPSALLAQHKSNWQLGIERDREHQAVETAISPDAGAGAAFGRFVSGLAHVVGQVGGGRCLDHAALGQHGARGGVGEQWCAGSEHDRREMDREGVK